MNEPQPVTVERLHGLRRRGVLSDEALQYGVERLTASRPAADWRRWLFTFTLSMAVLNLAGGGAYYVVVNWAAFGRYGQIALALVAFGVPAGVALRTGTDALGGKLAASAAAGLVGPLLVVLHTVYGSDQPVWQLMATWALLMAPFVAAARFAPLVLGWLAVCDLTLFALFEPIWRRYRDLPGEAPALAIFGFNILALLAWERLASRFEWMQARWSARVVGCSAMTMLVVAATPTTYWEGSWVGALAILLLLPTVAVSQLTYWRGGRDLLLAGAPLLAVIVVVANAGLGLLIEHFNDIASVVVGTPILIVALLVLTVSVLGWLRAGQSQAVDA